MEHEPDIYVDPARRGDREAFRKLVEVHSHTVFRIAFRILGDEASAEDAVQETFLRAYQSLSSFDGRARFSTWLHRIAVNQSIDLQRRLKRRRTEALPNDPVWNFADPTSADPRPDRLLASKQVGEATRRSLADLSELERSAFVLRHVEGCSIAEIGAALDLGTSATKQAIFRAAKNFGRSERLLAELSNASGEGLPDPALEQAWASELLTANRLYRLAAEGAGQKRIARLLAELEPVLLELAHAGTEPSAEEWNQLKRRVEERGLLFKVRVTEDRLDPNRHDTTNPTPHRETI
jgi:RNA polymerase sigma-70 factor (ECF subfamily)